MEGPVVIHGLPRTGTTALAHLLAVSPHFRFQRRWEISDPVPPPDVAAEADDPRRVAAVREAEAATPHASVQHISAVDGPFDDSIILGLDFHNQELALPIPSYTRWWRTSDFASTCAYHERVLRMLHSRRPPYRWLVKAPYHNFHLDELAGRYPHARFLMTHRDPVAAFPSTCSTVATSRWALPGQTPDPVALGEFLLEHLVEGIRRAMAARETIGEGRFLDITQQELEEDAVGTARRIHDFLGLVLDGTTGQAMESWAASNRRGVRGEHRYAPEDYGMTAAEIRRAFAPYIEAFDVQPEHRRAPTGVARHHGHATIPSAIGEA